MRAWINADSSEYPVSPYFVSSEPSQTRPGKAQRPGNSALSCQVLNARARLRGSLRVRREVVRLRRCVSLKGNRLFLRSRVLHLTTVVVIFEVISSQQSAIIRHYIGV